MLRNFSWSYFASTGDIHAYLLYKEHHQQNNFIDDEGTLSHSLSEQGESQACL
ncbi:YqzL family protein [Brevibacillus daliensis]|uniref:YqzL family protein n=1 Tax=Brevibacillus daliensis TaxID=2892995 RepID=UPI001E35FD21|nr:YqzL family protein [Brevibacillus daliensis]